MYEGPAQFLPRILQKAKATQGIQYINQTEFDYFLNKLGI
jgi:hypothetical protein